MTAVTGAMMVAAALDLRRARHAGGPERARSQENAHVAGVLAGAFVWFFGGLVTIGLLINIGDCGVGAAAPCLDRPGWTLSALSTVCLLSPAVLLVAVLWLGRRSRVCALLAPPLLCCLYLLGIHLRLPHVGLG